MASTSKLQKGDMHEPPRLRTRKQTPMRKRKNHPKCRKWACCQKACVLLSKVDRALTAPRRERRDPHDPPRLRTEVASESAAQEGTRMGSRRQNLISEESWRAEFIVKTMCFERNGKVGKNACSKHMCFSVESRAVPAGAHAGAPQPSRTTAPAHNSKSPESLLGIHPRIPVSPRIPPSIRKRCHQPQVGTPLPHAPGARMT